MNHLSSLFPGSALSQKSRLINDHGGRTNRDTGLSTIISFRMKRQEPENTISSMYVENSIGRTPTTGLVPGRPLAEGRRVSIIYSLSPMSPRVSCKDHKRRVLGSAVAAATSAIEGSRHRLRGCYPTSHHCVGITLGYH
jgi:hypothetical protein